MEYKIIGMGEFGGMLESCKPNLEEALSLAKAEIKTFINYNLIPSTGKLTIETNIESNTLVLKLFDIGSVVKIYPVY